MECLEEIKTTTKLATFKSNLKTMAFDLPWPLPAPKYATSSERRRKSVLVGVCGGRR